MKLYHIKDYSNAHFIVKEEHLPEFLQEYQEIGETIGDLKQKYVVEEFDLSTGYYELTGVR